MHRENIFKWERNISSSKPPYDGKAVANLLLDWCSHENIPVTPMKLQKLMFFCHSDFLAAKGVGLIEQEFEAWDFGPVIPYIFHEFRNFSKTPITERAYRFDPATAKRVYAKCLLDNEDLNLLRNIYNLYKNASASALSDLSHSPQGPWEVARSLFDEGRNPDRRISNQLIHKFQHRARYS